MGGMRDLLGVLSLASALAGCSLLYNPSDIPRPDPDASVVDAPLADADPTMLQLVAVTSPELLEGQGDLGSMPAVLVVTGHHLTPDATIAVAPTAANANVVLELGAKVVAIDGDWIAVPVTARVMPSVDESNGSIPLTVTVAQVGISATTSWSLKPLDDITEAVATSLQPPYKAQYSHIDIDGDLEIKGSGTSELARLRAVAGIRIAGMVTAVSSVTGASDRDAVAGGCAGGQPGGPGGCPSVSGGGATGGGGGGGGFSSDGSPGAGANNGAAGAEAGDALISSWAMNVGGGGGGGGGGLGNGGAGGASGGRIELTAGGNLSVGAITMNGRPGTAAQVLSLGGAGGGGAGGAILVRAGGTLSVGALSARGGAGGATPAAKAGGMGADGRIRYDAASPPAITSTPEAHRGFSIAPLTPPITRTKMQAVTVSGTPGDQFDVYVVNGGASTKTGDQTLFGASLQVMLALRIGHDQICVVPRGVAFATIEARTCTEIAYLP